MTTPTNQSGTRNRVRVRFAPSPTGSLHIGNARTALFNWLFARKNGGDFVLRIEDTDTARSTKESEEGIIGDLAWLGITHDEGPVIEGPFAPYRQSERSHIYNNHLSLLLEQGKAYRCYCSQEELEEGKKKQIQNSRMPSYSGRCRNLKPGDEQKFVDEGRAPVVRLKVATGNIVFNDLIRGEISFDAGSLGGDFVIVRSNGGFMYNFTVVIDDALMKISHVIRGEDHLTNTVKQILLYDALSLSPPEFAHCPMIVGEDKKRLSKRFLNDSFAIFRDEGIMSDALINYIALLGWSSRDGTEIFSRDELVKRFDLPGVSKSPSVFSHDKLKWVNGEHIKMMSVENFARALFEFTIKHRPDFKADSGRFLEFARIIKEGLTLLKDALEYLDMFFSARIKPSAQALEVLSQNGAASVVRSFFECLSDENIIDNEAYKRIISKIKKDLGVNGRALFMPIRAAVTGETKGPDLDAVCIFSGKDVLSERIEYMMSNYLK